MARRARNTAPPITVAEARTAVAEAMKPTASFAPLPAVAGSFTEGHQGGPRLSWANYGGGMTYNPLSPLNTTLGSIPNREAHRAASIASDFQFSNPTVATIFDTLETTGVGTGLTVSSKPDADALGISPEEARALAHAMETKFATWAANPLECDWTGRFDLHQIAATAYRVALVTGEVLAVMGWNRHPGGRYFSKVNLLNPGQLDTFFTRFIDNMRVLQGVAFDEAGVLVGYFIRSAPLGNTFVNPMPKFIPTRTRFGRRLVVHIFEAKDARQIRGVSPIVAALTPSQDKAFLGERILAAAAVQASFAMTVESDDVTVREGLGAEDELAAFKAWAEAREIYYGRNALNIAPGKVNFLPRGDKLRMNTPGSPNAEFDAYDKSLNRQAARAAGSTYEDTSGDYSNTNFAASRMANHVPSLLNAKRRRNYVEGLYRAAYECFVEEAIAMGEVELPKNAPPFWSMRDAYCKASFLGSPPPEPDKLKAANAAKTELELGLSTLTDALAARGTDFESHVETLQSEREVLRAAGFVHPLDLAAMKAKGKSTDHKEPDDDDV